MKKSKKYFILFLILSILILLFIFFNSTRSGEESNAVSTGLMNRILSIIDPYGKLDVEIVHFLIRKAAHFTEFALLGGCICFMMLSVLQLKGTLYKSLMFLIVLLAGVCDEYIQSFTSRTSSAKDVLLDFAGACFGILLAWLIGKGIENKSHKK